MASSTLDTDVEADCCVESSETDLDLPPGLGTHSMMGIVSRQPKVKPAPSPENFGVVTRQTSHNSSKTNRLNQTPVNSFSPTSSAAHQAATASGFAVHQYIQTAQDIRDDMIEDGAHVVFDWDNTLKLYDNKTHELSCRVSKQFLLHLKHDRHCQLYIISAIRPSALNLGTILSEVDKLGLTDVFTRDSGDVVDGSRAADKAVVTAEYAHKGNIIICGYDKAETFLKLSMFDSSRGDKVMFFDDEVVNINNFSALVPNSKCYLCE